MLLRFWLYSLLIMLSAQGAHSQNRTAFERPDRGFTSWLPAFDWEHAMVTGNGTMGALVYGQPHKETVIFSQSDLYLPVNKPLKPINQASRLDEIKTLLLEGKADEAAKIPVDQRNKEGFNIGRDPFIPAFNLTIEHQASNIDKYQRSVNFESGETIVDWKDATGQFSRQVFASRADNLIVLRIKGNSKINCKLSFDSVPVKWNQWSTLSPILADQKSDASEIWLSYRGTFKTQFEGRLQGYDGVGRLKLDGGKSKVSDNNIEIVDADEVLLLIKLEPCFDSRSKVDVIKKQLLDLKLGYYELLSRHKLIHGELFNRVKLDLNADNLSRKLHSEELLLSAKDSVSKALIERTYDAGRYNILSATGKNPPNLQGLWSGTWLAPWSSDFTHDGNLPAAIAQNLSGNMPELMHSYFNYHERFITVYRDNAKRLYGSSGIRIPAHTSVDGLDTDFGDIWCLTLWTGAAGWAANFYYDYYQYTGDKKFLRERAYPFMKEALLFYEDFLKTGPDGKLIFNPSYSPENNPANSSSQAAINATMDVMIAKQLLRKCIRAAKVLGDKSKLQKWEEMIANMPEYQVAADGTLKEWLWPGLEENHKHRHSSQLYALFDEASPEFLNNPMLLNAVRRTIDEKLKFRRAEGGGEMAFGLVQLGLVAAHIAEADKAKELVDWLASKYWSTAFGSFHNVGDLFNTDISGGLPAVINEMLVYSEPEYISLLPALPKEWSTGKVEGLLLRGNTELRELSWKPKHLKVVLHSKTNRKVALRLPSSIKFVKGLNSYPKGQQIDLNLYAGKDLILEIELN